MSWIAAVSETTLLRTKPWLVLCWGAPAAGKSTISRAFCESLETTIPRLSSDAVNHALIGDRFQAALRPAIYDGLLAMAESILRRDGALVLDGTFLNYQTRAEVARLAERCGATFVCVHVACPLRLRLERNARRGDAERVPERWLREAHSKAHYGGKDSHVLVDTSVTGVEEGVETIMKSLLQRLRKKHGLVRKAAVHLSVQA